jgi:hypothetical protein
MVTPEDIGEEWLSRSNEERDELLHSLRKKLLEPDRGALPEAPEEQQS